MAAPDVSVVCHGFPNALYQETLVMCAHNFWFLIKGSWLEMHLGYTQNLDKKITHGENHG